ncbi:hypothetical protein THRCLA_01990 [Thraustotheca clavata]|uniref:Uncharacterized protein n=1 Tax=Thraustotheca clavata TaxID=74557 RepID=A0A1W0A6S5_9STRA|nr:hypothetical protein THRCLA_01990 [Thraustotheca clavata]
MDLDACLDILKARSKCDHEHEAVPCSVESVAHTLEHSLKVEEPSADDLAEMAIVQLYNAFLACQTKRVEIYAEFEKGFVELMWKEEFAVFSQEITKHFATVSARINRIEQCLREKMANDLANLIRKIQVQEKEKLLLTSALLLERMRLERTRQDNAEDVSVGIYDTSIKKMQASNTKIIETINDLLEEMRYAITELSE